MALRSIVDRIEELAVLRALITDYDGMLQPFIDVLLLARDELLKLGVQVLDVTPATSMALQIPSGAENIVAAWNTAQNSTVTAVGNQAVGAALTLRIRNASGTSRVITFGTGFAVPGTLTCANARAATISFVSDGTRFYETGRVINIP